MTRVATALLLLLGAVAGVLALSLPAPGDGAPSRALSSAIALAGLAVLGTALVGVRPRGPQRTSWATVRLLVYLLIGACIVQVLRFSPFEPSGFFLRVNVALAVGAAILVARRRAQGRPPVAVRVVDLLVGVLLLLVVGAEVGLRIVAASSPSPLFAARDMRPEDRVRCFRYQPSTIVAGTPANELGYPAPPFERTGGERVVLLVSDRTLGGGLPALAGPAAVAHRRMPDTAFWPLALDGLSTPEYAQLLESDGFGLGPDAAIVVLDLSDDLVELRRDEGPWRPLALWLDSGNSALCLALRRTLLAVDERARVGDAADAALRAPAVTTEEEAARAFPWIDDPAAEPERGSSARLVRLAGAALRANAGSDSDRLVRRALEDLASMAQECAARDVSFGVAILPARYQVDVRLWESIRSGLPDEARDAPLGALRQRLESRAIAYADLTPILRTAQPWTDGEPHLFHRGTHELNARGDRLVGEAVAAFAKQLLKRERPR